MEVDIKYTDTAKEVSFNYQFCPEKQTRTEYTDHKERIGTEKRR